MVMMRKILRRKPGRGHRNFVENVPYAVKNTLGLENLGTSGQVTGFYPVESSMTLLWWQELGRSRSPRAAPGACHGTTPGMPARCQLTAVTMT